jgi:hypothetical protein
METWNNISQNEKIEEDFLSYVKDGMGANAVVWSLVLMRMTFFSQMEFQWQNLKKRTLFGDQGLMVLENPWPNGSTAEMLARMEQDVSCAGNAFVYRPAPADSSRETELLEAKFALDLEVWDCRNCTRSRSGLCKTHARAEQVLPTNVTAPNLQRLRPDWVEIVTDGEQLLGYAYTPGGEKSKGPGRTKYMTPDEVAHWSPMPDPLGMFRGMSWITPVVREVLADKKMTQHKERFFDNAATPNLLIKNTKLLDEDSRNRLFRQLEQRHEGSINAYRTLVLEGGADATIIGATMQQMSFDAIQAAGENRVASAAGVPGIVAGFKEGLQAATYSNYAQAKRHYVDGTLTFNWGSVCTALQTLVEPVPNNSRLWYDTSRIPALKEDRQAQAQIIELQAKSMSLMVLAGYEPSDVEVYVTTGERPDGGVRHTGLVYAAKGAEPEPGSEDKLGIQPTAPPGEQALPATDSKVQTVNSEQPGNSGNGNGAKPSSPPLPSQGKAPTPK